MAPSWSLQSTLNPCRHRLHRLRKKDATVLLGVFPCDDGGARDSAPCNPVRLPRWAQGGVIVFIELQLPRKILFPLPFSNQELPKGVKIQGSSCDQSTFQAMKQPCKPIGILVSEALCVANGKAQVSRLCYSIHLQ